MEGLGAVLARAALALYSFGLLDSLYSVVRQKRRMFKPALYAFVVGAGLHGLALASASVDSGRFPVRTLQQMSSMAAFFMTAVFLAVYARFKYQSVAIFVFPSVFLLALVGVLRGPAPPAPGAMAHWWPSLHAALFLLGYAALFLTCVAGVMYLIQERELKTKNLRALYHRLPPLGKLDEMGYQALAAAFVLVTLGLIAASVWAFLEWGANWLVDPTIALAFLTWAISFAMVISRLAAGWRGRKGAYLSIAGFGCAALTWVVNSGAHSFMVR